MAPILDRELSKSCAAPGGMRYKLSAEVMTGSTGTNAAPCSARVRGTHGALSVPLLNMHTSGEGGCPVRYRDAARVIARFAENL